MKKVFFLHIPKTAGQSVHAALEDAFGKEQICPARVNEQLLGFSIAELNKYRVFSGHLDWSLLDCVKGEKFVFTALREPMDRILSFYFYLREQGSKLTASERQRPDKQGLKAAYELTPKEYFLGGAPHFRKFIDDHYDNFYTYYFAGRRYSSRGELVGLVGRGVVSRDQVLNIALRNLSELDKVFVVDRLEEVFSAIREISGADLESNNKYRVNVNTKVAAELRRQKIIDLGADDETMARLDSYCSLDNVLWERVKNRCTL